MGDERIQGAGRAGILLAMALFLLGLGLSNSDVDALNREVARLYNQGRFAEAISLGSPNKARSKAQPITGDKPLRTS
jgi:hypothetical protein